MKKIYISIKYRKRIVTVVGWLSLFSAYGAVGAMEHFNLGIGRGTAQIVMGLAVFMFCMYKTGTIKKWLPKE